MNRLIYASLIVCLLGYCVSHLSACGEEPEPTPPPSSTATATTTPTPIASPTPTPMPMPTQYTYSIINTYPHDHNAFTQGLVFADGIFYEGTGLRGQSSLRKVAVESGEVLHGIALPPEFFGEGIVIWQDKIVQLTWQARVGFVYDKESFNLLQQFNYLTEGWGITHDGERLIMSDGTEKLYFWDPETLQEIGKIEVRNSQGPVIHLNELEYIQGEIYANVWQTDRIAIINPQTGQVRAWLDLSGLLTSINMVLPRPVDVLNGIAYDAETNRLFVTGKWWPVVFEIDLVEQ